MLKLGYSLGAGKNSRYTFKERLKMLSFVEKYAIELGYVAANRLEEALDVEDIREIKKFGYRSIHAPAILNEYENPEWIRYPSNKAEKIIEKLIEIANAINAQTILFHPDLVDDFSWLNNKIGKRIAFENMDVKKSFGKSVEDMVNVFSKAPEAKWVCDVNHLYTIDPTMKLAEDFHRAFGDRISHYHLSAYGGFHDCFNVSHEDIILKGIQDLSVPIIHEGRALRDGLPSLLKENEYILNKFKTKEYI